jgi:hypothetical protein
MAKRTHAPEELDTNDVDNDEDDGRFMNSNDDTMENVDDEDTDTDMTGERGDNQGNQGGRQGQGKNPGGGTHSSQSQGNQGGQQDTGNKQGKSGSSTGKKK